MKKQQLTSGVIIALICMLLSFSAGAQYKNLHNNNNSNVTTPDSLNSHNPGNPQSDEDIRKVPMNNMDKPLQTIPPSAPGGSLPSNYSKTVTPARLNRNMPDSTQHLNPAPKQRQDLSTPRDSSKKSMRSRNKNMYLMPDSTLKK